MQEKGRDQTYMLTLQNFIFKYIVQLKNVQRNKKKDKGEVTRRQISSNQMSKNFDIKI